MFQIHSASVRKNPPGVWCPYDLRIECTSYVKKEAGLIYDKKKIYDCDRYLTTLYFAEKYGYVSFFSWKEGFQDSGFNGSCFTIPVNQPDGSVVQETLMGPWSSNASAMAAHGFKQAVNVVMDGNISGYITLELAQETLKRFNLPYEYRRHHPSYCKQPDQFTFVVYPK